MEYEITEQQEWVWGRLVNAEPSISVREVDMIGPSVFVTFDVLDEGSSYSGGCLDIGPRGGIRRYRLHSRSLFGTDTTGGGALNMIRTLHNYSRRGWNALHSRVARYRIEDKRWA